MRGNVSHRKLRTDFLERSAARRLYSEFRDFRSGNGNHRHLTNLTNSEHLTAEMDCERAEGRILKAADERIERAGVELNDGRVVREGGEGEDLVRHTILHQVALVDELLA